VVNKTKAQRHTTCATKSKNNDKAFPTASLQNLENGEKRLAYNYQDMDYKLDEMPKTEALSK
jgi:hypothetical protein